MVVYLLWKKPSVERLFVTISAWCPIFPGGLATDNPRNEFSLVIIALIALWMTVIWICDGKVHLISPVRSVCGIWYCWLVVSFQAAYKAEESETLLPVSAPEVIPVSNYDNTWPSNSFNSGYLGVQFSSPSYLTSKTLGEVGPKQGCPRKLGAWFLSGF